MKKKILCILTALTLSAICLSGCTKKMTVQSILIDGQMVPVQTLLKIDSNEISLFEYRYYFASARDSVESDSDSDISDEDKLEKIKSDALDTIRNAYARYALTNDLGIKLTKENYKNVNDKIKQYKSVSGGDSAYRKDLAEAYLDEALFEKLLQADELSALIYDYYFGDDGINKLSVQAVTDYVHENYIHYKQIYVRFDYDGTDTNKKLMESIIKQLDEGADFGELMKKYSRDQNVSLYPNGYYAEKDYDSSLVKNLSSLEPGTYSGLITGDSGYYIYMRLDFDDDVLKNIDTFRSAMESSILNGIIKEYIEKQKTEIVSDYYYKINADNILY